MTIWTNYTQGSNSTISTGKDLHSVVLKHEIDIASLVANQNIQNADSVEIFAIPANTVLEDFRAQIITNFSLGAGARLDLGDGANALAYVNNASTLTADTWLTQVSASVPVLYSAAGSLRMKVTGGTIATGKIRFVAKLADYTRKAPTTTQT